MREKILSIIFLILSYKLITGLCWNEGMESRGGEMMRIQEEGEIGGVGGGGRTNITEVRTTGPRGVLLQPREGASYDNHVGNVGNIEVIYRGVSDGTNDEGARTCAIDLHLVPLLSNHTADISQVNDPAVIHLSYGLRPHDSGSSQPIWANFVPPSGACGDYRLVVYERQHYKNTVSHFQSAAPIIHFRCANQISPRLFPPVGEFVDDDEDNNFIYK